MGSNNNKNQQTGQKQYGDDPRGTSMNTINQQTQRYNQQQGPMVNAFAQNYGRGSEANYGDYTDIMNQYRGIASGSDAADYGGGDGGGGGGGGYSAFMVNPERVNAAQASAERVAAARALGPLERVTAKDPFGAGYSGYQDFSQTGGYSPADIANMRARGVAPIRAAYADAAQGIGRQRALQGGYSPNAVAARVKMAREQGQSMADANQNVEAGIAQARNQGRLAGLGGMTNIDQARLQAQMEGDIFNAGQANEGQKFDIGNEMNTNQFNAGQGNQVGMFNAGQMNDVGQFNANLNYQGQVYNADVQARAEAANNAAGASAANSRTQANAANMDDRFRALAGMQNLYGATPGMANTFGNQLLQGVGQGGQFGLGVMGATNQAGQQQGAFDQMAGRVNTGMDLVNRGLTAGSAFLNNRSQPQTGGYTGAPMNIPQGPATFGGYQPSVVSDTQRRRGLMGGTSFGG